MNYDKSAKFHSSADYFFVQGPWALSLCDQREKRNDEEEDTCTAVRALFDTFDTLEKKGCKPKFRNYLPAWKNQHFDSVAVACKSGSFDITTKKFKDGMENGCNGFAMCKSFLVAFFEPNIHVDEATHIQYDSFHLHEPSTLPITLRGRVTLLHLIDDLLENFVSFSSIRTILRIKHKHPETEMQHVNKTRAGHFETLACSWETVPIFPVLWKKFLPSLSASGRYKLPRQEQHSRQEILDPSSTFEALSSWYLVYNNTRSPFQTVGVPLRRSLIVVCFLRFVGWRIRRYNTICKICK